MNQSDELKTPSDSNLTLNDIQKWCTQSVKVGFEFDSEFTLNPFISLVPLIGFAVILTRSNGKELIDTVPVFADLDGTCDYRIEIEQNEKLLQIIPSTHCLYKVLMAIPAESIPIHDFIYKSWEIEEVHVGYISNYPDDEKLNELESQYFNVVRHRIIIL